MRADWNPSSKLLTVTPLPGDVPDPRSVSVKNVDTGRTDYYADSFCIPATGGCPANRTLYVIDAATANSKNYYLTYDGQVLLESSLTAILTDPKITSIAFDGSKWLLLRSDGAVMEGGDDLGGISIYNPSTKALTVTIRQGLTYASAPGVLKTDSTGPNSTTINPNGTAQFLMNYSVTPYGCHGNATYFGTITVTGNDGFVIGSGTLISNDEMSIQGGGGIANVSCNDKTFSVAGNHPF